MCDEELEVEKGSRGRRGGEEEVGCRVKDFIEAEGEVRQERSAQSIWSSKGDNDKMLTLHNFYHNSPKPSKLSNGRVSLLSQEIDRVIYKQMRSSRKHSSLVKNRPMGRARAIINRKVGRRVC